MEGASMNIDDYDDGVYESLMVPTPVGDFFTVPHRGLLVADVRKDCIRFKDCNDVLRFQLQGDPRKENQHQKLVRAGAGDPVVFREMSGVNIMTELLCGTKFMDACENDVEMSSLHYTWLAYAGDKEVEENYLFKIRMPSGIHKNVKFQVFLPGNLDKKAPDFVVKGDFKAHEYFIATRGVPVAGITNTLDSDKVRLEKNDFALKLCPGADHVFIVAVVAVMEQNNCDGFLPELKLRKDEPHNSNKNQ